MSITRQNQFCLRLSDEEQELIKQKMEQCDFQNMSAYLRKMAINGYVIIVDFKEMKELLRLMTRTAANVNQIAIRCNETGNLYAEDLEELKMGYMESTEQLKKAVGEVATLRKAC